MLRALPVWGATVKDYVVDTAGLHGPVKNYAMCTVGWNIAKATSITLKVAVSTPGGRA